MTQDYQNEDIQIEFNPKSDGFVYLKKFMIGLLEIKKKP